MTPTAYIRSIRSACGDPVDAVITSSELALAEIAMRVAGCVSTGFVRAVPPRVASLDLDDREVIS